MGRAGAPRAPTIFPPQGKAVSNHRIQEMMNHSHPILEIVDLRREASQNSSSLGFQDISFPGSPPAPAARRGPPARLGLTPASRLALSHSPCAGASSCGFKPRRHRCPCIPRMQSADTQHLCCAVAVLGSGIQRGDFLKSWPSQSIFYSSGGDRKRNTEIHR